MAKFEISSAEMQSTSENVLDNLPQQSFISKFETEFEVVKILGEFNAQATVFQVRKKGSEEVYVIKTYKLVIANTGDETHEEICARREAETLTTLKHPYIVEVFDAWTEQPPDGWKYNHDTLKSAEKAHFILMEHCSEGDLATWMKTNRTNDEIQSVFAQIVEAIYFLWQKKILHRDMKPENVLISTNGVVKVGDFGFARLFEDSMSSRPGTELYRAPEIRQRGQHQYTPEVDIFPVGIMYYEMVSGIGMLKAPNLFAWYEKVKELSQSLKVPDDFRAGHGKESVLIEWMLQALPERRATAGNVREWITGKHVYMNGKSGEIFGTLNAETTRITIVNAQDFYTNEGNEHGPVFKHDLLEANLPNMNLKSFTCEYFNDDDDKELPIEKKKYTWFDSYQVNPPSLLFGSHDITKINMLVKEHLHKTKIFQLDQESTTLLCTYKIPRKFLTINNSTLKHLVLYLVEDVSVNFLSTLPELETLNLNRPRDSPEAFSKDILPLLHSGENFPNLRSLYLCFLDEYVIDLQQFKLPNLVSLFIGNATVHGNCQESLPKLDQITFNDCKLLSFPENCPAAKYAFFIEDKPNLYPADMFNLLLISGTCQSIYYDECFLKPVPWYQKWFLSSTPPQIQAYLDMNQLSIGSKYVEVKMGQGKNRVVTTLSRDERMLLRHKLFGDYLLTHDYLGT